MDKTDEKYAKDMNDIIVSAVTTKTPNEKNGEPASTSSLPTNQSMSVEKRNFLSFRMRC